MTVNAEGDGRKGVYVGKGIPIVSSSNDQLIKENNRQTDMRTDRRTDRQTDTDWFCPKKRRRR